MPTNYPGSLDDFAGTSPASLGNDDTTGRTHSERHNDTELALEAVQAELGTDPAGASATVKARLDTLDTTVAGKVPASILDAKGDLIAATAADTAARLGVGTDGHVLTADSAEATGLKWASVSGASGIPAATVDAKGDLIAATAADTVTRLGVGTDGYVLTADSAEATGLKWTAGGAVAHTLTVAISDETTDLTTGTAKFTFRAPKAMTLTAIPRASLKTASSSGTPTFDINESGVSILSTLLTIDANETTSVTATTAAVLSDTSIADDAEITIDIDTAGTGAKGAKITFYYTVT